jgi:hypothetical protein
MTSRTRFSAALLAALAIAGPGAAADDDTWSAFRFLLGEWVGDGDGAPGKGSGGFALAPELGGKILVRKNRAEYPAANGRPASVHEDLMVIEPPGKDATARATYWDNEGHVIHYAVTSSDGGRGLVFLSEVTPGQPRFRLTYRAGQKDAVSLKFEIAPPDKADAFRTYIDATCHRKGSSPAK